MKDVINSLTMGSGGGAITGAATGQIMIAGISLFFMIAFGFWGGYLSYRNSKTIQEDSKAIRAALERGDIVEAVSRRSK
ncbi:MAG: hypothetical protein [Bacteriophage sp.]|jgi:hypothetical protein|nr:MAG: hypothetical protein [Bacteriophage sp.]